MSANLRHLVLGATGFIGRAVASRLVEQGAEVVLAGRTEPSTDDTLLGECPYRPFDMKTAAWDALIADCDVVHHYAWTSVPPEAARDPSGDFEANVHGTIGLLEAMRRRKGQRLVFASSGGTVYGRTRPVPSHEDDRPLPISAYGASKLSAETYINVYHLEHGLDARIARISNAYGPRQGARLDFGVVAHFARRAVAGETIRIWGDGEIIRDFVHIDDLAEALKLMAVASLSPADPRTFNIGSGCGVSINELLTCIRNALNLSLTPVYEPSRGFDVPYSVLDISRAHQLFGWRPIVTLVDGVASVITTLIEKKAPKRAD